MAEVSEGIKQKVSRERHVTLLAAPSWHQDGKRIKKGELYLCHFLSLWRS